MNYILETRRLTLRQFKNEDARFILELVNTPGWLEFIGDRNIHTEEDAINYLQNGPIKSYRENGFGSSMVELKDGTAIGMCGILKRDCLENPDIGFAFLPVYIGKGYAFEMAKATLDHATHQLKLNTICAITDPNNKRSIQLLEKIGLRHIKMVPSTTDEKELMLFSN
jgi:RimJ/RimL family protein N-acetyltransferase